MTHISPVLLRRRSSAQLKKEEELAALDGTPGLEAAELEVERRVAEKTSLTEVLNRFTALPAVTVEDVVMEENARRRLAALDGELSGAGAKLHELQAVEAQRVAARKRIEFDACLREAAAELVALARDTQKHAAELVAELDQLEVEGVRYYGRRPLYEGWQLVRASGCRSALEKLAVGLQEMERGASLQGKEDERLAREQYRWKHKDEIEAREKAERRAVAASALAEGTALRSSTPALNAVNLDNQ